MKKLKDLKFLAYCVVGIVLATVAIETRFTKAADFQSYMEKAAKERVEDKIARLKREQLFLLRPYQGDIKKATPYDKAIYDQLQLDLDRLYR